MVYNKPPPDQRPNWNRLNEGQRRYAWEQYNLALVRRGLPINHPIPESGHSNTDRREPSGGINETPSFEDVLNEGNQEILDGPSIEDFDESHFESGAQGPNNQSDSDMADSTVGQRPQAAKRQRTEAGPRTSADGAKKYQEKLS